MAEFTIDGARLHYDVKGDGDRTILFVHGHPFNRSMWERQSDKCAAMGWRSIQFDLRGYGASQSLEPTPFEFGRFSEDIEGLLDHVGVASAVLCGLSMGGQIVMDCCARMPLRVSGLILAATAPQAETPESRLDRLAMADRLEQDGIAPYADEVLPKMLAPQSIETMPEMADFVLDMMRRTAANGAAAAQRARAGRPSYEPTLATLDVPALIAVGDSDAFTSRADADLMHNLIPDAELLWLSGVGHMPNLERMADFNAAMLRLLDRVSATALTEPA